MKKTLRTILVSTSVIAASLQAQKPVSDTNLSCVAALQLPTTGLLAAMAGTSGTVHAAVHIGDEGRISKLELLSENRFLKGEVQVAINASKFRDKCRGRVVEFIFAFTLEDPPTEGIIPPAVVFVPPNRFELTFRRVKAVVEHASPEREQEKK